MEEQAKLKRLITGFIISIITLLCFVIGGIPLFVFMLAVVFMGLREYVQILEHKGFHPSLSLITFLTFVVALLVAFDIKFNTLSLLPFALTFGVIVAFLVVLFKGRQPYIANVATTVLGFMYGGWLPCHIILIRQIGMDDFNLFKISMNEGFFYIVLIFLVVLATDVGAYFMGSRYGKHKLAEIISPKKTIEGAIGGALGAILISMTAPLYTDFTLLQSIFFGVFVTLGAQLGDLSESLIKRDAGVKDSSDILPGHGGFLDRADSYIFALPFAYYFIIFFTQENNFLIELTKYIQGVL